MVFIFIGPDTSVRNPYDTTLYWMGKKHGDHILNPSYRNKDVPIQIYVSSRSLSYMKRKKLQKTW